MTKQEYRHELGMDAFYGALISAGALGAVLFDPCLTTAIVTAILLAAEARNLYKYSHADELNPPE